MQRQTKKRIAYYQEALPGLKAKIAGAGLMLAIAIVISVMTTYAWVTLSIAPVVSSVNTTVTSNGTLEIALSPDDGSQPQEFDIDESASANTQVTVSNLQWGNLINLSDASYGIDNLVLRPAQLNTASLKYSPLWGAVYGADGRISTLDSNYTYTKWMQGTDQSGNPTGQFEASDGYGVRAIASYTLGESTSTSAEYNTMAEAVNVAHQNVNNAYAKVPSKMTAMSDMLSSFAQSKLDDAEEAFTPPQLKSAYDLYKAVYDAMLLECDAMVALANFQSYVAAQNDPSLSYAPLSWDDLVAGKADYNTNSTDTKSRNGIISITGLTQFITDLNTAKTDVEALEKYYQGVDKIYWSTGGDANHQIVNIVTNLLKYDTMTMVFNGQEQKLVSLNTSMALDMLGLNKKHTNVYIYDGLLKRFEQLAINTSNRMQGQTNGAVATVKVTYLFVTVTVHGDCYTKASGASSFEVNYSEALGNKLVGKDAIAQDTYGMAVDFWLRTNAEETYLTLEGALTADNDGTIYSYDGVNRVWGSTGNTNLTTNSTTQGSGSCYIYYADTPEDMARSLDLLQSMKVAFVDADGNLMATAGMDTQNYYAINGRITVPLTIEENSGVSYTFIDDTNAEQTGRALVRMTHDEAKWVTAIIYLDGVHLGNDNVLAAADIDGQLNIQFGSSADLETRGDNDLLVEERSVSASATPTELDFMTALGAEALTTTVTVEVDGADPGTVTGFFVRAINSTQGERQRTMTFTKQEDGKWTANYVFDAPGTYYLRYVRLDGVDYALAEPPKVEVNGFVVQNVSWGEATKQATIYSAENYYEEPVYVKFATTVVNEMPKTVQARFINEDGNAVNADLRYDSSSSNWSGSATFYTSGIYKLQFLMLDGEYMDISEEGYVLDLSLGMNVAIYNNGSSLTDEYDPEEAEKNAYAKKVGVKLLDNAGDELSALGSWKCTVCNELFSGDPSENESALCDNCGGAEFKLVGGKLYYSLGGSATNTVDTDLIWDETNSWYTGTLPIVKPGRYVFQQVVIGENSLAKAVEAPVYTIISPDPPVYNTSTSTFHNQVQVVPLTNDAYIGPIDIDHVEAATMSAVVHNSITGEDYDIVMSTMVENANGTLYLDGDNWYIRLPVYTDDLDESGEPLANAVYTQEGVWSLKKISVWDCFDADTNIRSEDNPIVWVASAADAAEGEDALVVDFSRLSTEVSCSINVAFNAGSTALGTLDDAFMSDHYVKDIGMYVTLKDDEGRDIPADKVREIMMTASYAANEDVSTYGYAVDSNAGRNYSIYFKWDASAGSWTVDTTNSNHNWQYVGPYTAASLTVTMSNGITLPGDVGSTVYQVKSSAPEAQNLVVTRGTTSGSNLTVFGKTGNTVDGEFLEEQFGEKLADLTISLTPAADNGTSFAKISGLSLNVELTHTGKNQEYGGYNWGNQTNALTRISLPMVDSGANRYVAGKTSLLAGTYTRQISVTIDGQTTILDGWNDTIEVYSMAPGLTVASYSYDDGTSFTYVSGDLSSSDTDMVNNSNEASLKNKLKSCTNTLSETSNSQELTLRFPVVLISGTSNGSTRYGLFYNNSTVQDDYQDSSRQNEVKPSISFKLTNWGNVDTNPEVTFAGNQSVKWTFDKTTGISGVQNIGELNNNDRFSSAYCSGSVYWTKRTKFGSATVDSINLVNGGVTYTVKLDKSFTINNPD